MKMQNGIMKPSDPTTSIMRQGNQDTNHDSCTNRKTKSGTMTRTNFLKS